LVILLAKNGNSRQNLLDFWQHSNAIECQLKSNSCFKKDWQFTVKMNMLYLIKKKNVATYYKQYYYSKYLSNQIGIE